MTGATGNQGGTVGDHLLASEADREVLGLTHEAAGDLEARGAEVAPQKRQP